MVDIILTKGIEAQPRFPWEDLSEPNASMLELMLANHNLVTAGHLDSEGIVQEFRRMHSSVVDGTRRIYDDDPKVIAVNHGVACFETMHILLASAQEPLAHYAVHNSMALVVGLREQTLRRHIEAAYELFQERMRNAADVVKASAERNHGHYTTYALLGAAVMWQLALDSMPEPTGDFTDEEARQLGL